MLPKGKRLARASFAPLAAGKRAASAHFSVTLVPSADGRAAAVVSKKVAKSAADRNRLKRRIRAAIVPYVLPGRSFVVYARGGSDALPFRTVKEELAALFASLPRV